MNMNAKMAATILGVIFLAVGVLGFIPNPLVSPGGIFAVNPAHNAVHIVSGLIILGGAYSAVGARTTLLVVGVIYAVVAILGYVMSGDMLLGIIQVNDNDRWLHVVLAVVILAAGYFLPNGKK
ncbi:MAG: DUF4383 domain-containing protein [Rhizobiales bacterium]|nr:DUF4383 domain-containing protein [Hyphomicrobiales bacterium]